MEISRSGGFFRFSVAFLHNHNGVRLLHDKDGRSHPARRQSGTEVKLDEGFDPNLGFRIAVRALDNDAVVKWPEFHRRSFLRPAHSAAMPSIWAVWHSKDRSAKK